MKKKPQMKFIRSKNKDPILYEEEAFAFSLGHLLGDGSMKASKNRMCIDQADLDYTQWKKDMLMKYNLASDCQIEVVSRIREDKKTGDVIKTTSYRFETRSVYSEWHEPFYVLKSETDPTFVKSQKPKRRKRFPPELVDWFDHPLALAVFYMDDGGVQDNQAYFATGEVPLDEVLNIQKAMLVNFNLETTIRYSKEKPVGLLVRRQDCATFISLVKDYVNQVPSMRKKLNIT